MEDMLIVFNSLKVKAHNTLLAIETADEGINKIIDGKNAPEYEIASNNSYMGYQKIITQIKVSKESVSYSSQAPRLGITVLENNLLPILSCPIA